MDGWKNSGIYERGLKRFQFFFCLSSNLVHSGVCLSRTFFKVLGSNMIIAAAATPPPPPPPSRNHMPRTIRGQEQEYFIASSQAQPHLSPT